MAIYFIFNSLLTKEGKSSMNTMQLECFLAVAEHLNFSKAAQSVALTQPAVSHQIRALEEELGTALFTRTRKSVALTRAGLQFLGDASSILRIASTARARLSEPEAQSILFFGLGCHNYHEMELLPPMLRRLRADYPNLRPNLRIGPAHALERLMESESIHALLGFYNEQHPASFSGIYAEICRCPVVCVCEEGSALAAHESLEEKDLTGNLVICGPYRSGDVFFQLHSRAAAGRAAGEIYVSDSYEGCMALIQSGLGFSLFPYLPSMERAGLRCVPVRGFPLIPFGAYCRTSSSPVLRRFLAIARETLGGVAARGAQGQA